MAGSYERINYTLRPAKNIERKMMAEALRALSHLEPLGKYRYIGFGSTYFSDFSLFHRSLGIKKMLSIERDVDNSERFEFNRPFRCIELEFGESNAVLPRLDWAPATILWLDYDTKLDASALTDIAFFCANAVPCSVLIVTVNVQADLLRNEPRKLLAQRLTERKLPANTDDESLQHWGTGDMSYRVMANEIAEQLGIRNGVLPKAQRLQFKQLFHFRYADNARMLTYGGVLHEARQASDVASCRFEDFFFVRAGADPFLIEAPNLTLREIRFLDTHLPADDLTAIPHHAIPDEDLQRYSELYRYFPAFVDAEL